MIHINGKDLTLDQVIAVARSGEKVELSKEAKNAVIKAREYVDKKLHEHAVIYV